VGLLVFILLGAAIASVIVWSGGESRLSRGDAVLATLRRTHRALRMSPHEFERLVVDAAKEDHQHLVFLLLGLNKWMSRIQRLAGLKVTGGIHILRHTFSGKGYPGAGRTPKPLHHPAVHAPEAERPRWRPGSRSGPISPFSGR
jgi:hypothetical protein